jgi:hypothetical protein
MAGIRIGGTANVPTFPGPPFTILEGSTGGGADQSNLWIVNAAGTPIRLTPYVDPTCTPIPCGDDMQSPRLSPDGTVAAFFDFDPDDFGMSLYVVPVDGSATYPLSPTFRFWDDGGQGFWANHPCWHPDGDRIVFETASPDGGSYMGGTLGGRFVEVTYPGGVATDLWTPNVQSPNQREQGFQPSYSPDGTKIAFIIDNAVGGGGTMSRQGLWVMDADGSNVTQLDNWDSTHADSAYLYNGTQIAWSNDSQWIAYVDYGFAGGDGTFSVYKIKADGTSKTLLADGVSHTVAHYIGWGAWLDDDSAVICVQAGAIVSATADGSGTTELVSNADGPAGGQDFDACWRLRDRIYWIYALNNVLIRSCALDGSDIQTYYDGAPIDALVSLGTRSGFEWI